MMAIVPPLFWGEQSLGIWVSELFFFLLYAGEGENMTGAGSKSYLSESKAAHIALVFLTFMAGYYIPKASSLQYHNIKLVKDR